jgi:hypothetical protein
MVLANDYIWTAPAPRRQAKFRPYFSLRWLSLAYDFEQMSGS